MSKDFITPIRAEFGFTLDPEDLGDGGLAFISFMSFASGDSTQAHAMQSKYFEESGITPSSDRRATAKEVGPYIDWIIQNYWGTAPRTNH